MERQEVSKGGGERAGCVNLDLPQLGDGKKAPSGACESRVDAKDGSKYSERLRQQRRDAKKRYYDKNKKLINLKTVEYRRLNKSKIKPKQDVWRIKNKDKIRASHKAWVIKNRNSRRQYALNYRGLWTPEQRIKHNAYQKAYREKTKENRALYMKKWVVENRDRVIEKAKEYLPRRLAINKQRRATDPIQKLKDACRTRVAFILKKAGIAKFNHTFELVGCTPDFFKHHIESKWETWMNWENYGEWEIDHIKPLASFDLSIRAELLSAFHYSNCQPLEKILNRIKNAKLV